MAARFDDVSDAIFIHAAKPGQIERPGQAGQMVDVIDFGDGCVQGVGG